MVWNANRNVRRFARITRRSSLLRHPPFPANFPSADFFFSVQFQCSFSAVTSWHCSETALESAVKKGWDKIWLTALSNLSNQFRDLLSNYWDYHMQIHVSWPARHWLAADKSKNQQIIKKWLINCCCCWRWWWWWWWRCCDGELIFVDIPPGKRLSRVSW